MINKLISIKTALNTFSRKLIFFLFTFLNIITYSQLLPFSYIINKNKEYGEFIKKNIINTFQLTYQYGFNSKIKYFGNYKKSNKVDIVIGNHINTIDFGLYTSIINKFDNRNIYLIMKKELVNIPFIGYVLVNTTDLKLKRNINKDIDNINLFVNKINEGVILLLPEGTRFNKDKLKKAQDYSKENNLPLFNNTLFPKMKGIYNITNILHKNNKMGHLIDITSIIPKFKGKSMYMKRILFEELGDTFINIKNYKIPYIQDYDTFKKWFLKIWIIKDNYIENFNKYEYKDLNINFKTSTYVLIIILFCLFVNLNYKLKLIPFILTLFFLQYYPHPR
jgi:1-acyl-sn-glycerol-3-phosphate acyltransferase